MLCKLWEAIQLIKIIPCCTIEKQLYFLDKNIYSYNLISSINSTYLFVPEWVLKIFWKKQSFVTFWIFSLKKGTLGKTKNWFPDYNTIFNWFEGMYGEMYFTIYFQNKSSLWPEKHIGISKSWFFQPVFFGFQIYCFYSVFNFSPIVYFVCLIIWISFSLLINFISFYLNNVCR